MKEFYATIEVGIYDNLFTKQVTYARGRWLKALKMSDHNSSHHMVLLSLSGELLVQCICVGVRQWRSNNRSELFEVILAGGFLKVSCLISFQA